LNEAVLRELSTALGELQVANELLQNQVDELAKMRAESSSAQDARDEFANAAPIPVLWTDRMGVIAKGNDAASELLNIGKRHLTGKPMMLFVTDRARFFHALNSLCERRSETSVDIEVTVRPRERRPRKMRLHGCHLEHDEHCVWFVHEPALPFPAVE
jgi:nitrogen-specific signal transduction histidine kinase